MGGFTSAGRNPALAIALIKVDHLVEQGVVFSVQSIVESIPQNSTIDILFDFSEFSGNSLELYESIYTISSGRASARFYLPGDFSGGTEFPIYNRSELSDVTAKTKVRYKTGGATNPGAALPVSYSIGGGTNPASSGSGSKGESFLTELDPTVSRLLRIVHAGTAAFTFELQMIFAEIP